MVPIYQKPGQEFTSEANYTNTTIVSNLNLNVKA